MVSRTHLTNFLTRRYLAGVRMRPAPIHAFFLSPACRTCLVDGSDVETQWSTCTNDAQTSPVAGAEPREVMPLVSYRASVEAVLHEIHEVAGRRQSAKQMLW